MIISIKKYKNFQPLIFFNILLFKKAMSQNNGNNNLNLLLSNETKERIQGDNENRIKLSLEKAERAEQISSCKIDISDEKANRAVEDSKIKSRLSQIEAKLGTSQINTSTHHSPSESDKLILKIKAFLKFSIKLLLFSIQFFIVQTLLISKVN